MLTLELLLLSTVFLVVLISGLALLREALTRVARERMMSSVLVADSDGNIIGRARGFDEADAPRVLLREPESRVAVLLAVRTTRFASRQAVYFDQAGCRGAAFLFAPFSELGTTSELGALQRRAYGVGPGSGLYLSPPDALPGSPLVASRWVSSRGGPDNLCEGLSPQAVPGLIAAERVLSLGDLYRPPYSVPVPEAVAGDSAGPTRW